MSLNQCGINPPLDLSPQRRELKPQGTLDFPCAGYAERYAPDPDHSLPWHWHDEFEAIYILSGQLTVETPDASYHLAQGGCIAINTGVLHCASTAASCEIRSAVFSPGLITGGKDTVFAKKYIAPLAGCRAFRAYAFDRQAEAGAIQALVDACDALAAEDAGYEFVVRAKLSALCMALCRRFAPDFAAGRARPNQDEERIQRMLTFIQEHYDRPLTLACIARAAGIGERECLRCFGKTIHVPPMQYLLKYRVMQAADALLARPADSIAQRPDRRRLRLRQPQQLFPAVPPLLRLLPPRVPDAETGVMHPATFPTKSRFIHTQRKQRNAFFPGVSFFSWVSLVS